MAAALQVVSLEVETAADSSLDIIIELQVAGVELCLAGRVGACG